MPMLRITIAFFISPPFRSKLLRFRNKKTSYPAGFLSSGSRINSLRSLDLNRSCLTNQKPSARSSQFQLFSSILPGNCVSGRLQWKKPSDLWSKGFCLVAGAGLEPATFGLWAQRATYCSIPRCMFYNWSVVSFSAFPGFSFRCGRIQGQPGYIPTWVVQIYTIFMY